MISQTCFIHLINFCEIIQKLKESGFSNFNYFHNIIIFALYLLCKIIYENDFQEFNQNQIIIRKITITNFVNQQNSTLFKNEQ
ncbi:hypothetical protein pb186bvf_006487 [Paramecium bursaria]